MLLVRDTVACGQSGVSTRRTSRRAWPKARRRDISGRATLRQAPPSAYTRRHRCGIAQAISVRTTANARPDPATHSQSQSYGIDTTKTLTAEVYTSCRPFAEEQGPPSADGRDCSGRAPETRLFLSVFFIFPSNSFLLQLLSEPRACIPHVGDPILREKTRRARIENGTARARARALRSRL